MKTSKKVLRIAAVADIHFGRSPLEMLETLFARMQEEADVILLCGDLTDHGRAEEAKELTEKLLTPLKIPCLVVLGNHDCHSHQEEEITRHLCDSGIQMLDGECCEIGGVGFAGVKGFGGGFGRHALEPWGEDDIKNFVSTAVDEALKLESALARLSTEQRIAVLHYAPIQATVEGEPPPIFPFLGSSRLEEPINRYQVSAVFHGHAHHGTFEGKTSADIPVFNVSMPVLQAKSPRKPPFYLFELPIADAAGKQ